MLLRFATCALPEKLTRSERQHWHSSEHGKLLSTTPSLCLSLPISSAVELLFKLLQVLDSWPCYALVVTGRKGKGVEVTRVRSLQLYEAGLLAEHPRSMTP